MKKLIVAIIAFLYLGVSSGVAMEIHYCMGKKAGIEFYGSGNDKCGKCGMKEKKGCCNDEHKFYKINDSHKSVSNDVNFEAPVFAFSTPSYLNYNNHFVTDKDAKAINNHSPPIYTRSSACVLNCTFRL